MTLLSPIYLLCAAGVVAPVLIHLFGRRRPRHLRFPSLRLLRAAQQQRRSPVRLRRLIALLMRMAAIVLLSLALAGPVARSVLLRWLAPRQSLHTIVLDASASMTCRPGAATLFERGRQAARQIAAALPAGAHVSVATAGSRLHLMTPRPVPPARAPGIIEHMASGEARGRLAECALEALALAEEARLGPGTLYLITDLQGTSLAPLSRRVSARGGRVVVVDVGQGVESSAAVTDLMIAEPPPLRGRPLRLRARVEAWGKVAGGPIPLTLSAPPLPSLAHGVSPRAGSASLAEFEVVPAEAGLLRGRVELPGDALALDDQRLFAEHVLASISVLIVGDEASSRYPSAALDPYRRDRLRSQGDERSIMRVQRLPPEALAEEELSGFDVVVLADAARLEPEAVERLAAHVAAGGGALVFAGPGVEADAYAEGLLPALSLAGVELAEPVQFTEPLALADFEADRPPLAAFASPLAGDLMAPRFTSARELTLAADAGLTVLARFEDGTPALVEAAHDRGCVILANTAADARWSDLVRRPVYLPLMHRLVHHLSRGRRPQVRPAGPGEAVAGVTPPHLGAAQVTDPDAGPVHLSRRGSAWSFVPERTGAYLIAADGKEVGAFAVNLDAAESDPTRLTPAELRRRLSPLEVVLVRAADLREFLRRPASAAAEVSPLVVLLALLVLVVESVYSLEPPRTQSEGPAGRMSGLRRRTWKSSPT